MVVSIARGVVSSVGTIFIIIVIIYFGPRSISPGIVGWSGGAASNFHSRWSLALCSVESSQVWVRADHGVTFADIRANEEVDAAWVHVQCMGRFLLEPLPHRHLVDGFTFQVRGRSFVDQFVPRIIEGMLNDV